MARNERKRQLKLAKKNAKRKKALQQSSAAQVDRAARANARQALAAASAPIHECLVPRELFQTGMGNLFISRRLPNGYLAVSGFLADVYCLGIKDALFSLVTPWEYQGMVRKYQQQQEMERVEPAYLRKLVEATEAYALGLGFNPHPDYQIAKQLLGDIDKSSCSTDFTFGKDGKPFYISGPYDSPRKIKKIHDTLVQSCGPDGFSFVVVGGMFDEEDWELEEEDDWQEEDEEAADAEDR